MAASSNQFVDQLDKIIKHLEQQKPAETSRASDLKTSTESTKSLLLEQDQFKQDDITHIAVAESPPKKGGIYEKITMQKFRERPNSSSICFTNSILIDNNADLELAQQISKEILQEDPDKAEYFLSSSEIMAMTSNTIKGIRLANVGEEVGMSAFAGRKINRGELMLYSGKLVIGHPDKAISIKQNPHIFVTSNKKGDLKYYIDAARHRNFAAWIAHLHQEKYIRENIAHPKGKIASSNFVSVCVFVTDLQILLPVFVAVQDIEPDEILGVDYSILKYWHPLGVFPRSMDRFGALIPRNKISYTNYCKLSFFHPDFNGELNINMSWEEIDKQNFQFLVSKQGHMLFVLDDEFRTEIQQKRGLPEASIKVQKILTIEHLQQIARSTIQIMGENIQKYLSQQVPFTINLSQEKATISFNCRLPRQLYHKCCESLRSNNIIQHYKAYKFKTRGICGTSCGNRVVYAFFVNIEACYPLAQKFQLFQNLQKDLSEMQKENPDSKEDTLANHDHAVPDAVARRSSRPRFT